MRYMVILDAGHGVDTPGKRTPKFSDGTYMRENEFNRNVIRKIDYLLEQYENIDVVFTATEKYDVPLNERVKRANDYYNSFRGLYNNIILVSIHANAYGDGSSFNSANGTSSHYYLTNMTDKSLAQIIHKNLINSTNPSTNRGIVASDFMIIREVKMPAVLCENLFMTNLENAQLLLTEEFRQKTAVGIVKGVLEYFKLSDENLNQVNVDYTVTVNGTHQLRGDVKDFGLKIVNEISSNINISNCTNGTFYWWQNDEKTKTYPTSIIIKDGKIIQNYANHYYSFNCPQSVFIVYKDGNVDMKKVKFATDLDYRNIRVAIGGIGIINTKDVDFKYDPASEGFKKGYNLQTGIESDYSDVLRKANKTVIGYNYKENKIYLLCRKNIPHKSFFSYDLLSLVKDCEYDIALSIDGGGSTFMNNFSDTVLYGENKRINNIVGFGL